MGHEAIGDSGSSIFDRRNNARGRAPVPRVRAGPRTTRAKRPVEPVRRHFLRLEPGALIYPLFLCPGEGVRKVLYPGLSEHKGHALASRQMKGPGGMISFVIEGDVPRDAVERAIQLSRDKYCSVWHSMRQDIGFTTTFRVEN